MIPLGYLLFGSLAAAGLSLVSKVPAQRTPVSRPSQVSPSSARQQQLQEILPAEELQRRDAEMRAVNSDLTIAAVSLGFAVCGALWYTPLSLLSLSGLLFGAWRVYQKLYQGLKKGRYFQAELIIAITIITFISTQMYVFGNLANIVFFVYQKLLRKVTTDSELNLGGMLRNQARSTWLVVENSEVEISVEHLQPGDIIVVYGGETIPVDGTVIEGCGLVDQHILTGEAQPIEKEADTEVFASTLLLSGKLLIRVEQLGSHSVIGQIQQVLQNAANTKAKHQLQAEQLADRMVLPALLLSLIALPFLGAVRAVALLGLHPKRQLSLPVPLSLLNHLNLASRQGILIKDGRALERLSQVDVVFFDKTGTLTEERPEVVCIHASPNTPEEKVLYYAACAEVRQSHPFALAIMEEAKKRHLAVEVGEDVYCQRGLGIRLQLGEETVRVGSARFLELEGLLLETEQNKQQDECHAKGNSLIFVSVNDTIIGSIELRPRVRAEAIQVLQQLRQTNPRLKGCYILSGDHELPTRHLAQMLGMDGYYACHLPDDKAKLIADLQQAGQTVCFIGDGINDTIALKEAAVSVSIHGAASIATDSADIILMDGSLKHLPALFSIATRYDRSLKTIFTVSTAPRVAGLVGILWFNFSLPQIVVVNIISAFGGLGSALLASRGELDATPQAQAENPPAMSVNPLINL